MIIGDYTTKLSQPNILWIINCIYHIYIYCIIIVDYIILYRNPSRCQKSFHSARALWWFWRPASGPRRKIMGKMVEKQRKYLNIPCARVFPQQTSTHNVRRLVAALAVYSIRLYFAFFLFAQWIHRRLLHIFFAKSQWSYFDMRAWVRRLLAGWDHKARWNGPMAFVPRLKVAFISWLLDCATWGCCVSGFVELFGSRVISRDTPPNLRPAESWLCSNCSVKIFWTQLEDFGSNQLPWTVSTHCPLDMHWALMRAQLWQSPEATQSLDAQKGCHMRVMSVTSGGPKVVGPWDFLTIENSLIKIDQPIQRVSDPNTNQCHFSGLRPSTSRFWSCSWPQPSPIFAATWGPVAKIAGPLYQ